MYEEDTTLLGIMAETPRQGAPAIGDDDRQTSPASLPSWSCHNASRVSRDGFNGLVSSLSLSASAWQYTEEASLHSAASDRAGQQQRGRKSQSISGTCSHSSCRAAGEFQEEPEASCSPCIEDHAATPEAAAAAQPAAAPAARPRLPLLHIDPASCQEQGSWDGAGWTTSCDSPASTQLPDGLPQLPRDSLVMQQELGRGFYSRVWQASWRGRNVAVKELLGDMGASTAGCTPSDNGSSSCSPSLRAALLAEAAKLAELRHEHVVTLVGVVCEPSCCALVMEHMPSGSLKAALQLLRGQGRGEGREGVRLKLACALGVARGMEYLHSRGFVHFDLKPDNMLCDLTAPGAPVVKIGDLGLAEKQSGSCVAGSGRGTMSFMAPELFCSAGGEAWCESQVDEKVDVYSFGVCMLDIWGMCSQAVYPGMQRGDLLAGLLTGSLRPEVPRDMDPAWAQLMQSCWNAAPASRPSFSELASELEAMLNAMPAVCA